jgi:hypothetical protein
VLATQDVIEALADRIERAYRLRRPQWHGTCSTPRVWSVAASTLLGAHETDPSLPSDPELFVAAQPEGCPYPDPWSELTQPGSVRRYRKRVREIVRGLRGELTAEVKLAEDRVSSGQTIGRVLLSKTRRISPLARFIVAQRAGRQALANRFRHDAVEQHRSCPLYRQASRTLLPPGAYPVAESSRDANAAAPLRRTRTQVHLN